MVFAAVLYARRRGGGLGSSAADARHQRAPQRGRRRPPLRPRPPAGEQRGHRHDPRRGRRGARARRAFGRVTASCTS
jgi:hypothetical protein